MPKDLLLAFYGDDFTGSADLIMQYQRFGLDSVLFLGAPDQGELEAAAETHAVIGIAGVTRAMEPEAIRAQLIPALEQLAQLNPDFLLYKVCSTADSSPTVGSFEPAITWGQHLMCGAPVPVLVAQPNLGRYTVFSNHFAVDRGNVHRLDRQSIMTNHPVTPMKEADLRLHIELQLGMPVYGVDILALADVEQGSSGTLMRSMMEPLRSFSTALLKTTSDEQVNSCFAIRRTCKDSGWDRAASALESHPR